MESESPVVINLTDNNYVEIDKDGKWNFIGKWYPCFSTNYNYNYLIKIDDNYLLSYKLQKFTLLEFTKTRYKINCLKFTNLKDAENISKLLRYRLKNYTIYVDTL